MKNPVSQSVLLHSMAIVANILAGPHCPVSGNYLQKSF